MTIRTSFPRSQALRPSPIRSPAHRNRAARGWSVRSAGDDRVIALSSCHAMGEQSRSSWRHGCLIVLTAAPPHDRRPPRRAATAPAIPRHRQTGECHAGDRGNRRPAFRRTTAARIPTRCTSNLTCSSPNVGIRADVNRGHVTCVAQPGPASIDAQRRQHHARPARGSPSRIRSARRVPHRAPLTPCTR